MAKTDQTKAIAFYFKRLLSFTLYSSLVLVYINLRLVHSEIQSHLFDSPLPVSKKYAFPLNSRYLRQQTKTHTNTRATPLAGERIEAFQSLPSWFSNSRFSEHFAVERQKAIRHYIEAERKKAKLDTLWCDTLSESLKFGNLDNSDPEFFIEPNQVCANMENGKDANVEEEKFLLESTSEALTASVNNRFAKAWFDSNQFSHSRTNVLDKLLKKDHLFSSFGQDIKLNETAVGFQVNPYQKDYRLHLERPYWSIKTQNSLNDGITSIAGGVGRFELSAMTSAMNEEVEVAAGFKDYGVFVDRSVLGHATGVTFISPLLESNTLADFKDHQYGQRIRLGKFEIAIRHDFDEFENPDPEEMSTEFLVGYGDVGISLVNDIKEKAYGLGTHIRGHHISVFHDFDDHISKFSAMSSKGFKFILEYDLPDKENTAISGEFGLGLKESAFFKIGAGIAASGLPQLQFQATVPDSKVTVSLGHSGNSSLIDYSVRLRGSSFGQRFSLDPAKLQIPHVFSLTPSRINSLVRHIFYPLGSENHST